jgi:hypothetical protein
MADDWTGGQSEFGWRSRLAARRLLSLPVRLAFDDEFVGGRLQSVRRLLSQQRVGHHGQDLRDSRSRSMGI